MTDPVMPGMGGHELASQIERRFPSICLLYTSGYSEDGASRRQLLDAGRVFLEKPYTVADLDRAVQRTLLQSRLQSHTTALG